MTVSVLPIFGYPNLVDQTYIGPGYGTVRLTGGGFETTRPRSYLRDPLLAKAARTTSAGVTDTWLNVDMGRNAPVKLVAVPRHNLSRNAQYRLLASTAAAFSGVTVNGVNSAGATSVSLTAAAQASIFKGDAFTIAGDATVYQATADVGFGENLLANSLTPTAANWTYAIDGSSFAVTDGIDDPFGGCRARRFAYTTGGDGLIRITASGTPFTTGNTYNTAIYARLQSVTRSQDDYTIALQLCAGTAQLFQAADMPLGQWVRVSKDLVAGASGQELDIRKGSFVTAYTIDLIAVQVTAGAGIKALAASGAAAVNSLTQSVPIIRVDSATSGLAVATAGAEAVTAECGRFDVTATASTILDTGLVDVWRDYFDTVQVASGDKKFPAHQAEDHPQPLVWIKAEDGEVVTAAYWRLQLVDTANADGFVSLARLVMAPGYEPTRGVSVGASFGRFSNSSMVESKGGARFAVREAGGRTWTLAVDFVPEDEAQMELWRFLTGADVTEQLFFVFDKTATRHLATQSFLATLESINPLLLPGTRTADAAFALREVTA